MQTESQTCVALYKYLKDTVSPLFPLKSRNLHHSLRYYKDALQKGPEHLTAGNVAEKIRELKLAIEYGHHLFK